MAAGFATNYGNSENSGLNFWEAKRTIVQVLAIGSPQYLKGYFNENNTGQSTIIGVDLAIYDANPNFSIGTAITTFNKMQLIPTASGGGIGGNYGNDNIILGISGYGAYSNGQISRDLISITGVFGGNTASYLGANNTIIAIGTVATVNVSLSATDPFNNIFSNFPSGILFPATLVDAKRIRYNFFRNCKFKFVLTGGASNETTFTYPTGATNQLKIDNLRARMATVYGGVVSDYLIGCEYSDEPETTFFIDPSRNNYYLVPGSTPTKMSYDGKYIGARPEGSFLVFNSSNFTYTNFDVNGNIVDQRIDASAISNIVNLGQIRTVNKLDSLAQLAVRNGNDLNIVETVLPNPMIFSDALTLDKTYKVYNAQITVGAKTYIVGECFIAKGTSFASGADTFSILAIIAGTTLTDLACYQVEIGGSVTYMGVTYTTGQRFQCYFESASTFTGTGTVKKFDGGFVRQISEFYGITGITAGTALRDMQTYEVVGGTSITYLSVVYTVGKKFTCIASSSTAFTQAGGSTLREFNIGYPKSLELKGSKTDSALSTDVWVKMSLSDIPTVNYDANGKITFGNLDSGFDRATAQPLNIKFWQCRLTVQSLNIPV